MSRRPPTGCPPASLLLSLILAAGGLMSSPAGAQWSFDPRINTPVCLAPAAQSNSVSASDGAGGVFIAWVDTRGGAADIYAQHLDATGAPTWAPNGMPICVAPLVQGNPAIVSDGLGGAIIAWQDSRGALTFDIYAQRVTLAGAILWPLNGALVCGAPVDQLWPMLVSDGAGGAIIGWEDSRAGGPTPWEIFAHRITAAGAVPWVPPNGVPICQDGFGGADQLMPMLVADGAGGAIITWYDGRGGGLAGSDIYAQRVTGAGAVSWAANGALVCNAPLAQTQPTIITDGAGGAIITWYDGRLGNDDIFAQRMNAAGARAWLPPNGVVLCANPAAQQFPKIVSDGGGGAIISWHDFRNLADNDIYAQHVNGAGATTWPFNGAAVFAGPGDQMLPKIVTDGAGGAIIAWNDILGPFNTDIRAQRLNAAGAPQWPFAAAVPISVPPLAQNWQFQFMPIVADGNGGAIISWTDGRAGGAATDIYAQNVRADGNIGRAPLAFWRLDEGAGTTVGDASGNGHTGNVGNNPNFTANVACATIGGLADAGSLNFSPTPPAPPAPPNFGSVEVPDSPTLRPTNAITLEAWVRPQAGTIVSKQFYDAGPPQKDAASFALRASGAPAGGLTFTLCDAAGVETAVTFGTGRPFPPPNEWTHVAGTWDAASGTMRLFVNFVEVTSAAFAGPIAYSARPVVLGARDRLAGASRSEYYFGDLDEVRVYDTALTPAQMLQMTCPLAPTLLVNTPATGEVIMPTTLYDITWQAFDAGGVASLMLELTVDGTTSYSVLSAGEANDGTYSWDVPVSLSNQCQIRITATDNDGNSRTESSLGFFTIAWPAGVDPAIVPAHLALALHPNPFRSSLTATYAVPKPGAVDVAVFDAGGRRVATLASGEKPSGTSTAVWDGRDSRGNQLGVGRYFVRVTHGGRQEVQSTVLLR